jgi:futalosine hydrolase
LHPDLIAMEILLVAATPFEILPVQDWLKKEFSVEKDGTFRKNGLQVSVLITGVGITATAWSLGRYFARKQPDLAINAGIAGAFDRSLQLGTVVHVVSERFGDLGVEEADGTFTDLFGLGLLEPAEKPYVNAHLYNPAASESRFLPPAKGVTVNKVHGSQASIDAILGKYPDAQVESMEGAAFFYACLQSDVPFLEIRSISNYVEPRNREGWQLALAIENLNGTVAEMLGSLEK